MCERFVAESKEHKVNYLVKLSPQILLLFIPFGLSSRREITEGRGYTERLELYDYSYTIKTNAYA